MTITTFDAKTALVLIDLQKGILALPVVHPAAEILAHGVTLADAFRSKGRPVLFVHVTGGAPGRTDGGAGGGAFPADFATLAPELKRTEAEPLIEKKTWGAFTNTDLDAKLKALGVTQIVLAGIATSIGVESTARFASELGYNVTLVTDAMTDMKADAHANSVANIFPRLGETGTVQDVLALLETAG